MAMRTVVAPDGCTWTVGRRWLPRSVRGSLWSRFRSKVRGTGRRARDAADVDPGCFDVIGEGVVAAVAIVVAVLVVLFVLLPLLVAVVDLLVILVLAALGVLARTLLGRPWSVEATAGDGAIIRREVVGWRASGATIDAVADGLASGALPRPGERTSSD